MMTALRSKSLTELRGIAQSFELPDIFEKDAIQLIQAIEAKTARMAQDALPPLPERPSYDARLMSTHPRKRCNPGEIVEVLEPLVARGLHLRFDDERWYIAFGERNDEGTLRMPLRTVLDCAERLMRAKRR